MSEFVIVATFHNIHQTVIIRAKLESEGIPTMIRNETTSYLVPMFDNFNKGVRIEVNAEDAIRAREILKEAGYQED